jgi:histone H3/H4
MYQSNINSALVKPRIKNLCTKAGIKQVNSLVYEEIRGITKVFLEEYLEKILKVLDFYKKTTISVNHVQLVSQRHLLLKSNTIPKCKKSKKIQICLEFSKAPFHRLLQEIAKDIVQYNSIFRFSLYSNTIRFEQEAYDLIQYYTEQYLLHLLRDAHMVMISAKRDTVFPKDLQLVQRGLLLNQ